MLLEFTFFSHSLTLRSILLFSLLQLYNSAEWHLLQSFLPLEISNYFITSTFLCLIWFCTLCVWAKYSQLCPKNNLRPSFCLFQPFIKALLCEYQTGANDILTHSSSSIVVTRAASRFEHSDGVILMNKYSTTVANEVFSRAADWPVSVTKRLQVHENQLHVRRTVTRWRNEAESLPNRCSHSETVPMSDRQRVCGNDRGKKSRRKQVKNLWFIVIQRGGIRADFNTAGSENETTEEKQRRFPKHYELKKPFHKAVMRNRAFISAH